MHGGWTYCSCYEVAGAYGGCWCLLDSNFMVDTILICISGRIWVSVTEGLPEGCLLGTLCYNLLLTL